MIFSNDLRLRTLELLSHGVLVMWFAVVLLVVACAGAGYVFLVVSKYKRLLRRSSVADPSGAERTQVRRAVADRRGMGAQSDFISETFVPSKAHKDQQLNMARSMIAAGLEPKLAAARVGVSEDLLDAT